MDWITLTESDLLTVVSDAELTAWRQTALAAGQADPVSAVMATVALLVRGYAAHQVTPGATGTIPDTLTSTALDLVAYRLPLRVGDKPTEARKNAYDAAMELLRSCAKGEFKLAGGGPARAEIVTSSDRQTSREKLEGL